MTATTTIIADAVRAAINMISIERQSFADCNARPDRSIDPGDATILREYDDVLAQLHAALVAADHDAVRIMQTVVEKGHDYVLIVEPRDGGSRLQMTNRMRRIEVARMLERFAREAREDARLGGDE